MTRTNPSSSRASNEHLSVGSTRTPLYLQSDDDQGCELAATLDLEVIDAQYAPSDCWYLGCQRGTLALCHSTENPLVISERAVRSKIDDARYTHLAKACNARIGRRVLDAFGGWGIDGFTLSALGCVVTILEVNPLICAMARLLAIELGCNADVVCTDAETYLRSTNEIYDVVYFDPMFPAHRKNAKPVRRMQVLETLASQHTDFDQVFELAKSQARDRVVVKQRRTDTPRKLAPDWNISGKTVRFDIYQIR